MLSWWHYRWHGHQLVGRPSEPVWYFVYGSNMHHSAFRERRRMRPTEWRVGRLTGYRLRFHLEGRPVGKAAPANICADADGELWGVLYRITRRELLRLDSTEGVPGRNYRQIEGPHLPDEPAPRPRGGRRARRGHARACVWRFLVIDPAGTIRRRNTDVELRSVYGD